MSGWYFLKIQALGNTMGTKHINYELCLHPKYGISIQVLQKRQTLFQNKVKKKSFLRASLDMQNGKMLVPSEQSEKKHFQIKKYIITFIYLWMDGWACMHFPRATRLQLWTFMPDGCTVINNVFPFWAIKYFNSGSLVWSAELKGASTVVVEGRRIFGAQNFPSSLKQRWVVTPNGVIVFASND